MSFQSHVTKHAERAMLAATVLVCGAATTAAWGDVTISTGQTQNMSCSGGVCAPTAASATLNVTDLENLLASGAAEVTTTGSGVQAGNIDVTAAFTWSGTSALTLDAYQSISVGAGISVTGAGGLTIHTNDGGKGAFSLGSGGEITFADLSSALIINRDSFTLENSIQSLRAAIVDNPKGAYALASNYDASQDGTYTNDPIRMPLAGTFEGLGNAIENLSINDSTDKSIGLFEQTLQGSNIRDLIVSNASITASNAGYEGAAAVVGYNYGNISRSLATGNITETSSSTSNLGTLAGVNEGTISDSSSSVTVSNQGSEPAGGLVGSNIGTISNSFATGEVEGTGTNDDLGGLAGSNYGHIFGSYATGSVLAEPPKGETVSYVDMGGLAGDNAGWILKSHATGLVESTAAGLAENDLGGLSGSNSGLISESFESGAVDGSGLTGGLVGLNDPSGVPPAKIIDCYANGATRGGLYTGGLIGENAGGTIIKYSYATGKVAGGEAGGFTGADISNHGIGISYWDTTTSHEKKGTGNYGNEPGLKGLTTSEFQSGLPRGFNPKIWTENANINNGLPYLKANPPPQ